MQVLRLISKLFCNAPKKYIYNSNAVENKIGCEWCIRGRRVYKRYEYIENELSTRICWIMKLNLKQSFELRNFHLSSLFILPLSHPRFEFKTVKFGWTLKRKYKLFEYIYIPDTNATLIKWKICLVKTFPLNSMHSLIIKQMMRLNIYIRLQ